MEDQPVVTAHVVEWSAFQSAAVAALLALLLVVVIAATVLAHVQ